jgi:hypothetical protein
MRLEGTPPNTTNRLYKNNRGGTFTEVTAAAGLTHSGWGSAACIGDFNNDGFEDLFCTYLGQNKLYRNNGNGTFTDATEQAGLKDASLRLRSPSDKQLRQDPDYRGVLWPQAAA